ncbi:hypothetical protein [uncultured Sphingomonas sp.]|uniref:hypothetical protein n=1 Tax=uncultured Sphingomonas sp. TaxID=158754 RepID=UPI0026350F9E|nr:hypothetical protein [uncultured Sphingomonas sp.]
MWIVQTFMLRDQKVVGWHGFVGDAVAASYRIPRNMTARDAALDFWGFFNEDFGGEDRTVPGWFAGLDDPTYRQGASD